MVTIKPRGKNGRLDVVDDNGHIVGFGRVKASKTKPGYCTITVDVYGSQDNPMVESFKNGFSIFRVPINWIETLNA